MQKLNEIQPVRIAVILDRSGSMNNIRADAIGGFNRFLKDQQGQPGDATLSLYQFDHEYTPVYVNVPLAHVAPLTEATFVPRGQTALNDAIGRTLSGMFAENYERAIVVILTDGQENASAEFRKDDVRKLITDADRRGWKVVYLSAGIDAFNDASSYGVAKAATRGFAANSAGMADAYTAASSFSTSYRNSK